MTSLKPKPLVTKVVIPVAGLGTRMLPATKAIPKEMLTVADRPLIQYIVEECAASGLKDIILVTHSSKNAIENHFDTSFELESTLEKRVKRQLLDEVRSITPEGVTIMHVRQGQAKGLGHAVLCARPLVGDCPFAVVLPDMLLDPYASVASQDNLACMIQRFNETGENQVLIEPVPQHAVHQYGIVDVGGAVLNAGDNAAITSIVEKPKPEEAPSNFAVVGRYVFSQVLWPLLESVRPDSNGEIQLTDAMGCLLEKQPLSAHHVRGQTYDCGNPLGYLQAFAHFGMSHPENGAAFKRWIRQYVSE